MAKFLILLLLLQVGIGTTDPQATLDIRALPGDPLENTGILIPSVNELPIPCEDIPNGLIVFFNGIETGNLKQGLYIFSLRDCNWKRIIGV
jgi:hypothetical protein